MNEQAPHGALLQGHAEAYRARVAAIAATRAGYRGRAVAALAGGFFASIVVVLAGAWFVAPFTIAIGSAIAALMMRVAARFEPLPAELLTHGRPTPAVIVAARPVGPGLRATFAENPRSGARRSEYRIEVRPPGAPAYPVVLTTFDGPRPVGLEGRPLTVYVDPADPRRIYPHWAAFEAAY
jgi:type IV secretory pathway TrbD component